VIEIHLDGKPVTKLQAARALAPVGTRRVVIGELDDDGQVGRGSVAVRARHQAYGLTFSPEVSWPSGAEAPCGARTFMALIALGAEVAELAEMIVAEQEADKPKPVVWQCTYCWTEYEAMPSEQPPVCPECGPLHGPGAPHAQPRIKQAGAGHG
jgi:hypothetical protein